jgi:Na+-transporting NADH:ubiquinone oxidoreductase subunit B
MKQPMMRRLVYALIPILVASIYFYGWRALILCIVSTLAAVFSEWMFKRKSKKPVSEAVFVTSLLFTLTLPPSTPYWIAAVGISFGIIFGKEVFGGFGRNVFNPALVGRAFVYVSFPKFLTIQWTENALNSSPIGAFTSYLAPQVDAVSTATPMLLFRSTGELTSYKSLLLGNISGSMGETSAILIIIAAIYLIYTKTAAIESMFGVIIGFLSLTIIMNMLGIAQVPNPIFGLLSGGLLFGAVFMATDPISSPKTKEAKWIYGIMIGMITVIIRGFALFAGGIMFAILIGNTFAPILDELVKYLKTKKIKRSDNNA